MSDVYLESNVVEDIFLQAINSIPRQGSSIAQMIASKTKRKPLTNQQLFHKTMQSMKNMNVGKEADILKFATRNYLQQKHGMPACDVNAYDLKEGKGKITLKYKPDNPGGIPFAFWMNKRGLENQTITETRPEKTYTRLTPEDVKSKLTENARWLEQKAVYKQRIANIFHANPEQLHEIFKDDVPGRADFSGCEITGFDFSQYDVSGANFKGAKLDGCTFQKAGSANFFEAVIDGCVFAGADLAASDFQKSVINDTTFDKADLKDCNFAQAEPKDATFREAAIKGTNLDFVQPKNVVFESEGHVPVAEKKETRKYKPRTAHGAAPSKGAERKNPKRPEALPAKNTQAPDDKQKEKVNELKPTAVKQEPSQGKAPSPAAPSVEPPMM